MTSSLIEVASLLIESCYCWFLEYFALDVFTAKLCTKNHLLIPLNSSDFWSTHSTSDILSYQILPILQSVYQVRIPTFLPNLCMVIIIRISSSGKHIGIGGMKCYVINAVNAVYVNVRVEQLLDCFIQQQNSYWYKKG